ncbi:universal stress protein [Streptomyces xantholiticus]|uniref:Universal stress protein n=1 Tax=Streptomyces xantholiticus TaxID=68285 RepID=A0ABV1UP21_9ACTN
MNTGSVGGPELGTIVVGVDGSEHAKAAALWAAAEADRRGRPLRILYGADLDRLTRLASMETIEQIREAGRVLLLETARPLDHGAARRRGSDDCDRGLRGFGRHCPCHHGQHDGRSGAGGAS